MHCVWCRFRLVKSARGLQVLISTTMGHRERHTKRSTHVDDTQMHTCTATLKPPPLITRLPTLQVHNQAAHARLKRARTQCLQSDVAFPGKPDGRGFAECNWRCPQSHTQCTQLPYALSAQCTL